MDKRTITIAAITFIAGILVSGIFFTQCYRLPVTGAGVLVFLNKNEYRENETPLLKIINDSHNKICYQEPYSFEKKDGEKWVLIDVFGPEVAFVPECLNFVKPGQIVKQYINIEGLDEGMYRVRQSVIDLSNEQATEFVVEFTIKNR